MTTVASISPYRSVHDIVARSKAKREFIIDIYENSPGHYESEVTALDLVSPNPGSWLYKIKPKSASAKDNYQASIELVIEYLRSVDSNDSVVDLHNPCNCPFVSQSDQDAINKSLGLSVTVRVN